MTMFNYSKPMLFQPLTRDEVSRAKGMLLRTTNLVNAGQMKLGEEVVGIICGEEDAAIWRLVVELGRKDFHGWIARFGGGMAMDRGTMRIVPDEAALAAYSAWLFAGMERIPDFDEWLEDGDAA